MQHGNDANDAIREGEPPLIPASRDRSLEDYRGPTRLNCFFAIMAITCCPFFGGLIAYLTHHWWFRGGGSFAVISDFIGGIAFGGILGLVVGVLVVNLIGRFQRPSNRQT